MELRIRQTWDGDDCLPEEQVKVTLQKNESELIIRVHAPFHGDQAPPSPPGPTDFLWEYEVVEVFILGSEERYTEIELGPHGHYLVLQLAGRRNPIRRCLPIQYEASIQGLEWTAIARVPLELLPHDADQINATAIHGEGHQRRFLAWSPMPGSEPDFHRLDLFQPFQWNEYNQ